jgi:serine protein kinase
VDTARDARLGRVFMNRTIRVYPAFAEFYGMEETIERIVSFFRHAAQALEDRGDLVAGLQHVDRMDLHQRLQALGKRRLTAADGAEQVEESRSASASRAAASPA